MILFSFDDVAWLNHDITFDVGCVMTNGEGYIYMSIENTFLMFFGICNVTICLFLQFHHPCNTCTFFNISIHWPLKITAYVGIYQNLIVCWKKTFYCHDCNEANQRTRTAYMFRLFSGELFTRNCSHWENL